MNLKDASGNQLAVSLDDGMYALMETSRGSILLELAYDKTPLTVTNFAGLAQGTIPSSRGTVPYYNGLTFHRVIPEFMIQGGDPTGTGSGGPGYKFPDEIHPSLKHDRPGVLSMANSGPGTNGSQFFITHVPTPWLDGKHTVFGYVVRGQDVVDAVRTGDTIESVEIIRRGEQAQSCIADKESFDALLDGHKQAQAETGKEEISRQVQLIQERHTGLLEGPEGILYRVDKEGTGDAVKPGSAVSLHYTGMLADGKVFDTSRKRGPLQFELGAGKIIPGFEAAVSTMRSGEKRTVIIPPHLAYGEGGAQGVIPPHAVLVFEMELL